MATTPALENKYTLRSVHEEIDLYDRRLAHLLKYDVFESDTARDAAARKLTLKRDALVLTSKRMIADGIEFKESELPRSLRPEGAPPPEPRKAAEPEPVAAVPTENRNTRRQGSSMPGAALDWEKSVAQYMQSKKV